MSKLITEQVSVKNIITNTTVATFNSQCISEDDNYIIAKVDNNITRFNKKYYKLA
jgi:hypothetical protein